MMKTLSIVAALSVLIATPISVAVEDGDNTASRSSFAVELKDIVFIVLSQPNTYHIERANLFKEQLNIEVSKLGSNDATILLLHEHWPDIKSWTIFPIVEDIARDHGQQKWVLFCDAETRFHLKELIHQLSFFDYAKIQFLGQGLQDSSPVIIHHFEHEIAKFNYPNFFAGFAMSMPLVNQLTKVLKEIAPIRDFTIDLKHELALYIFKNMNETRLTPVSFLCTADSKPDKPCATFLSETFPKCGEPVAEDDLHIAVKTCEKFHETRIPVVQKTWGKEAKHVVFYSEVENASIPTVSLGIPNTDSGHCAKMYGILQRFVTDDKFAKMNWLMIVDDDTLLSVPLLKKLLKCYNSAESVMLGERYGYGLSKSYGYSYPTGGAGMVFSRVAVEAIVNCRSCTCPTPQSPDDMILGSWLKQLNIPVTHSSSFHQARPYDYAAEYLSSQVPVSFHKHWNCDPYQVYRDWLDKPQEKVESDEHTEL